MIVAAWIIFGFAVLRLLVIISNYMWPQKLTFHNSDKTVSIAVLIPARNEEKNIGNLLEDLSKQTFRPKVIRVYNDNSTDGTERIVLEWMKKMPQLELINGRELPKGWLGKHHACSKMAEEADTDYILFLDADVRIQPTLITRALGEAQNYNLQLLSIFPGQTMVTFGESIVVPLMNWILTSLLPMELIKISSNPRFSAANGQFMLFENKCYKEQAFHSEFRMDPIEDIHIMKMMKSKKMRVRTLLSQGEISCRMYENGRDAVCGFSKNVFAFFGDSVLLTLLFMLVTSLGWVVVFYALPFWLGLVYLAIVLNIRALAASLGRQTRNVFFVYPIQQLAFTWVVLRALIGKVTRKLEWKGRNIYE